MNRQRVIWIGTGILVALCAARYGHHHVYELADHYTANDFAHQFLAARAIDEGLSPYRPEVLLEMANRSGVPRLNPFVYPPFAGLLVLPLAHDTYRDAYFWWTVVNQLFLMASIALLIWGFPMLRRPLNVAALAALVAFSEPLWRSFSAGQLNTVLLILLVGALAMLAKGRTIPAAILIAVAAHVKVVPLLLLFIFVWKRDWRALGAGVAALLAIFLVTLCWVPWNVQWEYVDVLKQMSYGSSTWSQYAQNFQVEPANQSLSALLYRLLTDNAQTQSLANMPGLAKALSLGLTLLLLALVAWRLRLRPHANTGDETVWAFLVLWWFILPTPSLCWDHYLVQLLPHMILLFAWLCRDRRWYALAALIVAAVLIERRVVFWDPAYREGWGIVWASSKLYGVLMLGWLLLSVSAWVDAEWLHNILKQADREETVSWEEVKAKAGL